MKMRKFSISNPALEMRSGGGNFSDFPVWASRINSEKSSRPSILHEAPIVQTREKMKTPEIQSFRFFAALSFAKTENFAVQNCSELFSMIRFE